MLETKNLKKVYKTKKGVSVEALKGISLKFPDTGMIFLLGKSGSGKSTLLNLLGGLDQYDDGEIIIRGVSSKDFKQSHFDSYRNTYVGFIFQEYNVLEEFTVGANIALAIELQGRKAGDREINEILKQVDLEGFGERKPNELSGGQKQRVAIARALVKNPQIIMADEPTGALDSATGRQVFDTLKKLSKDKLVIIVSHDREFAEYYGDRIIELSDGNVISDVERVSEYQTTEQKSDNIIIQHEKDESESEIVFEEETMWIPEGYHLTEEDRKKINEYIASRDKGITAKFKKHKKGMFEATNQSKIRQSAGDFQLIKSKLPMKNSFKIGASGLKHKKIRLVVTIALSFVAFSLFALADTFGNYHHIDTCTKSIMDSNIQYSSFVKSVKQEVDSDYSYWDDYSYRLTEKEINTVSKETKIDFKGVYVPHEELALSNYGKDVKLTENESDDEDANVYATYFSGFAEITKSDLDKMGYKLAAGKMPDGAKNEVVISEYVYKTYEKAGYIAENHANNKIQIKKYEDMLGKTLTIGSKEYTVVGIVDTNVDMKRYESVSQSGTTKSTAERLATFALMNELGGIKRYSLSCVAMTGEGHVKKMIDEQPDVINMDNFYMYLQNDNSHADAISIAKLDNIDTSKVTWLDGEKKTLGDKEIIVHVDEFYVREKQLNTKAIIDYLKNHPDYTMEYMSYSSNDTKTEEGWKIVGIIEDEDLSGVYVLPNRLYDMDWNKNQGDYAYAVSFMPQSEKDVKQLVQYCYTQKDGIRYKMQNPVTFELDAVNEILQVLSKVFLYIGIGFALFAALMLSNFIATSISYKKQEIGILRAIGARSNDVFRIFFSESFIIAMINFVLSCIMTGVGTALINNAIRYDGGIMITVLNFGARQIVLLFVISVLVAAVASFIPVYKTASKKPVEAIRNK